MNYHYFEYFTMIFVNIEHKRFNFKTNISFM